MRNLTKKPARLSAILPKALVLILITQLALLQQSCSSLVSSKPPDVISPGSRAPNNIVIPDVDEILSKANTYASDKQYTRAALYIQQGLVLYPDNARLQAAYSYCNSLSQKQRQFLKTDALIKHSLWLRSELNKESVALLAEPSIFKKWNISRIEAKQRRMHDELLKCALQTMKENKVLANRCLDAVDPDKLTAIQKDQISQIVLQASREPMLAGIAEKPRLANETSRPDNQPTNQTKLDLPLKSVQNTNREVNALRKALKERNYIRAKDLSIKIRKNKASTQKAKELLKIADKEIQTYTDTLAKKADELYLQEKVAEADLLWIQLMKLNPETNEFRQNHERAKKILRNIKSIKEETNSSVVGVPKPPPY